MAGALGLVLVLVGGAWVGSAPRVAEPVTVALAGDPLADQIAWAQRRLGATPGDWRSWARLAMLYLEQSRASGDPSWYAKAEQAVAQSFERGPAANPDASIAAGALANARHDFAQARGHALDALAVNAFSASAYAVLGDAETQLGNREAATEAIQRMLDLRPGLPAYSRAAYDLEQRGLVTEAEAMLRRARADAVQPSDIAFCEVALGDLAWHTGRVAVAAEHYTSALRAQPENVAALLGRARVTGARGDLDAALADYAALTRRAPAPAYFLEYAVILEAAGEQTQAQRQVELAGAAQALFVANGGVDGLADVAVALATGNVPAALAAAQGEWSRRQHADVADALAWTLYRSGRAAEALPYADLAVGAGAQNASYAYHRGLIHLALGHASLARADLRQALKTNPYFSLVDAPAARVALRTIEETR